MVHLRSLIMICLSWSWSSITWSALTQSGGCLVWVWKFPAWVSCRCPVNPSLMLHNVASSYGHFVWDFFFTHPVYLWCDGQPSPAELPGVSPGHGMGSWSNGTALQYLLKIDSDNLLHVRLFFWLEIVAPDWLSNNSLLRLLLLGLCRIALGSPDIPWKFRQLDQSIPSKWYIRSVWSLGSLIWCGTTY